MNRLVIRREGGLIVLLMKGRIQAVLFGHVQRIQAEGTVIGDGVDVYLRLTVPEARAAGEMLLELARQAERHLRELVIVPHGKPPPELEGIVS